MKRPRWAAPRRPEERSGAAPRRLLRSFVILRALRWAPLGVALPFVVLLPQARGLGLGAIGAMWAVHSIVNIVLEVPSGGLADTAGRRNALLAGALLTAAGLGVYGMATGLAAFMAATGAIAAGRALISGSLEAWFVDEVRTIDPDLALQRPMAAGGTAEGIGTGLGAALGGLLPLIGTGLPHDGHATLVRLSVPLLGAAALALVYAVAVLRLVDETRRPSPGGWRDAATVTRSGLGLARRSVNVRLLLLIAAFTGTVMCTVELLWQPRLSALLGGEPADAAFLFGVLTAASMLASAAGTAVSPALVHRTGRRAAFVAAIGFTGAMLALLAAAGTAFLFAALFLVFYCGTGLSYPVEQEVLHEGLEDRTRATVASAQGLALQVGGLGGNLGIVPLAGVIGIGAALGVAAALTLGAAAVASVIASPAVATPRRRPAAPSGAA